MILGKDPIYNLEAEVYSAKEVRDGAIKLRGVNLVDEMSRCRRKNTHPIHRKRYVDYSESFLILIDKGIRKCIELHKM